MSIKLARSPSGRIHIVGGIDPGSVAAAAPRPALSLSVPWWRERGAVAGLASAPAHVGATVRWTAPSMPDVQAPVASSAPAAPACGTGIAGLWCKFVGWLRSL
jgi:hypothetical protein